MITSICIDGFKSFHNFKLTFSPLTVIAGVNGSGKSNLFDALQLLSRLTDVELYRAFTGDELRGNIDELFTQYSESEKADVMKFIIEMLVPKKVSDSWGHSADLTYTRLKYTLEITREKDDYGRDILFVSEESLVPIKREEDNWIKAIFKGNPQKREMWIPKVHGKPVKYISTSIHERKISLHQDVRGGRKKDFIINNNLKQTILSSITSVDFRHALAVNLEMKNWRFMQLSPQDLRKPNSYDKWEGDIITETGKNLSAALFRIKQTDPYSMISISRRLNQLINGFKEVVVDDDTANKQYVISIISNDDKKYSSRVLSEGTLRLLALCVLCEDTKHAGLLCFEEPENGINPQRIHLILDLLKDLIVDFDDPDSPLRQVIINTHSPLVIGNMIKLSKNPFVCVWLSDLSMLNETIKGKRYNLKITRMNRVNLDSEPTLFDGDLNIARYTLNSVLHYLESADVESAKDTVKEAQDHLL